MYRFVVQICVDRDEYTSDPVDYTNSDEINSLLAEWSEQLHLNIDHLRLAVPIAIQNCANALKAQARRRSIELNALDENPTPVEPSTKNIDTVVRWATTRLTSCLIDGSWYTLLFHGNKCHQYREGKGYVVLSKEEADIVLLKLVKRVVNNSTIGFRKEVMAHLKAQLSIPGNIQLGRWLPPMIRPFNLDNFQTEQYRDRLLRYPADEMLATPDGLVHLPTVDLNFPEPMELTPAWFGAVATKVSIEPCAERPGWEAHLNLVFGNDAAGDLNKLALQDWFGYCLMPHARLNKFCMLHGASQSGKSTCLRVLCSIVESASLTATQLGQQFDLERLEGYTHAGIEEVKIDKEWHRSAAASTLLTLSGGMQTTIQRKSISSIDTHPALKLTMTANNMPSFDNSYNAITNRIHPIFFSQTLPLKRPGIEMEWIQNESSGILAWAIEGYQRVYQNNQLTLPGTLNESLYQLTLETDPVTEFINECLIPSTPGAPFHEPHAKLSVVFEAYRGHCAATNVKPLTRRELKQLLITRHNYVIVSPTNHHVEQVERIHMTTLTPEGERHSVAYRQSIR